MELNWSKLLCDWRTPSPGKPPGPKAAEPFRTHFESDYDRVVYSQPFRRLARKTQVHPMAPNDHVHNRLTHSVEVASVGRSFARRLELLLSENQQMPEGRNGSDLAWILMAACAAHDIGNPPFGHAGEYAIREWSNSHQSIVFPDTLSLDPATRRDLLTFEGNAQGFRIASRSDNEMAGHLRLTFATLGTMVKYPWDSSDGRAATSGKYNFFASEREVFDQTFTALGLVEGDRVARHPMSFLSEAADDICYRVLDLEDAAEIGVISSDRVRSIYFTFLNTGQRDSQLPLPMVRGMVIQQLIIESWRVFSDDYAAIMNGDRHNDLKHDFPRQLQDGLAHVREAYREIFSEKAKVATELGAYKCLGRILKALCNAVSALKQRSTVDDLMFVTRRTLDLAWDRSYIERHRDKSFDWWLHQVLDYVSGLTDNYSRQLSREIEGT